MRLAFLLLCLLSVFARPVDAAGLVVEETRLRVEIPGLPAPVGLTAVVVRPDDRLRRPLAIISHGAPRDAADRAGMSPAASLAQAAQFARRGFVAAVVMRRGYGASDGPYAETTGRCDAPDYDRSVATSAADVRAAIEALRGHPSVDDRTILAVGQSAGGLATVALTADPPMGLVAAISFAGGRGSPAPDEICAPDRLVAAFGRIGARSRTPMLWIYTENDRYFAPRWSRAFHAAFAEAGGRATFLLLPAFGEDGHGLFASGIAQWTPLVDRFLAEQGIAAPPAAPAALDPPRGLGEAGIKGFGEYLAAPPHKAFASSPGGAWAWRSGRRSAEAARDETLAACNAFARGASCVIRAENDRPSK